MKRNAMSLKATINNMAKSNKVSPQALLQVYMLERLLERISVSPYKNNFILKGGMLIAAILGINFRSTMDMDTTVKGFSLNQENITEILFEICNIDLNDDVTFKIEKIDDIREEDDYGGYRITFIALYQNQMPVILKIDITTGDIITYREIHYSFPLLFENKSIFIWSYNIETILAEKFESIIKRNVLGTRIRDYYDIYMLWSTQYKFINFKTLKLAIIATATHRGTLSIINNYKEAIIELENNPQMKNQWAKYQNCYEYAKGITYESIIDCIKSIGYIYDNGK